MTTEGTTNIASNGLVEQMIVMPAAGAIADGEEQRSPLEVRRVDYLQLGWVREYANIMTRLTGSPFEFNQLAGLVTAAAALQRRAYIKMTFADIYPNIYGCIIAPSSVFHKSATIHKPRTVLQRAMMDKLLLSELMTSEGLLKQMQGQPSGVILRDEIGTLFDSGNTKYLRQLKPDLTAIYDCYPYSRRLSNDEIKVEKPYLSILGATTPTRFFEGTTLTDWRDGFLARWLFCLPEGEPDFDAMTGIFQPSHEGEIQRLALKLMEIERQAETPFTLTKEALSLWDGWQRQAAKDAYYFGDDVTAAIVTRYSAYALKFSILLAAVNDSWGMITADTMQTAINLSNNYKLYVHKLLSEKANFGLSGAKLQKVFKMVQRPPQDKDGKQLTATRKTLMQYGNMKKAELEPCIEKLLEIGAIAEHGKAFIAMAEQLPLKSWK